MFALICHCERSVAIFVFIGFKIAASLVPRGDRKSQRSKAVKTINRVLKLTAMPRGGSLTSSMRDSSLFAKDPVPLSFMFAQSDGAVFLMKNTRMRAKT